MSRSGASDSRCRSWATIRLATSSSIAVPRNTTRSFSSREYRSNARSPRLLCSMTVGTRSWLNGASWVVGDRHVHVQPLGCTTVWTLAARCATMRLLVSDRSETRMRQGPGDGPAIDRELATTAPPDAVGAALTDVERLGDWLEADVELEVRPGGSGRFSFADGEERRAMVEAVRPRAELTFSWWRSDEAGRADDPATTTVTFLL